MLGITDLPRKYRIIPIETVNGVRLELRHRGKFQLVKFEWKLVDFKNTSQYPSEKELYLQTKALIIKAIELESEKY